MHLSVLKSIFLLATLMAPSIASADTPDIRQQSSVSSSEVNCQSLTRDLMQGLDEIRVSRDQIRDSCRLNMNSRFNQQFGVSGTRNNVEFKAGACEAAYGTIGYFGRQVQNRIDQVCRKVNEAKREAARKGCTQNTCQDLDQKLARDVRIEIDAGKDLLRQAQDMLEERANAIMNVANEYSKVYADPNATPESLGFNNWNDFYSANGISDRIPAAKVILDSFRSPGDPAAGEGRLAMEQERAFNVAQRAKAAFQGIETKLDRIGSALGNQSTITTGRSSNMASLPTNESGGAAEKLAAVGNPVLSGIAAASSRQRDAESQEKSAGISNADSPSRRQMDESLSQSSPRTDRNLASVASESSETKKESKSGDKEIQETIALFAAGKTWTREENQIHEGDTPGSHRSKSITDSGAFGIGKSEKTHAREEKEGNKKEKANDVGLKMTGGLAAKEKSEGSLEEKILGKEKFADSDSLRELLRRRLDERKKRGDATDASSAVDEVLSSIHAEKEHAWESAAQYVEKGGLLSKESVPLFKRVHDALGRYQQRVQMENAGI